MKLGIHQLNTHSRLEIWTMDELEAVWNKTPMPNFQEEPRMLLKTKSVFDPRKVNEISGIPDWSDLHYKRRYLKEDNALSRQRSIWIKRRSTCKS